MAVHPVAVIHDGIVEIPDNVKSDPRFQNGSRLELVPYSSGRQSVLQRLSQLGGSWAHSPVEPVAVLEGERRSELASEAHWRA